MMVNGCRTDGVELNWKAKEPRAGSDNGNG